MRTWMSAVIRPGLSPISVQTTSAPVISLISSIDCYTAVFYEERCAVIDLVAVKTLQNSREKVADVCCYCCGGKSVCNVDLYGRVLLAFLFDRLNCFRRELTSKIRTGQIRILAVALCLYDEKALILYKLFVYVIEDCILCCRVCCTELQLRECLISCACFADTKTARCELSSALHTPLRSTGFSTRYCLRMSISVISCRHPSSITDGSSSTPFFGIFRLMPSDAAAFGAAASVAAATAAVVFSSEETFISCNTCSIIAFKSFCFHGTVHLLPYLMNTDASPASLVSLPFSEKPIFSSHWSNSLIGRRPNTSRRAAAS